MAPEEFRSRLRGLGLTIGGFASLTGVNPTTAQYWGRDRPGEGVRPFPAWVPLLLEAWERSPDLLAA